jgi:predicted lipase
VSDRPTTEELSKQIQRAIEKLPEMLDQNQVEALLMTIAQGYAPNLQTAVTVLFNAGITLEDVATAVHESETATKN